MSAMAQIVDPQGSDGSLAALSEHLLASLYPRSTPTQNPPMLIAIFMLSLIAVIGVVFWDVRKRKQTLRHPNATQNPSEKTKWAVGITLSVFFTLLAIWDCINLETAVTCPQ